MLKEEYSIYSSIKTASSFMASPPLSTELTGRLLKFSTRFSLSTAPILKLVPPISIPIMILCALKTKMPPTTVLAAEGVFVTGIRGWRRCRI